jgi:hypothetical protein
MDTVTKSRERAAPWNKGKLFGQKPPLKLKDIWAIRIRLQLSRRSRSYARFWCMSGGAGVEKEAYLC